MKYSSSNRGLPAGNPIANIFVILVGALIIAVSIVLGFVAFVVLGTVIAILAAVIGLRLWWLNRALRRRGADGAASRAGGNAGYIEGEYRVVDRAKDDTGER